MAQITQSLEQAEDLKDKLVDLKHQEVYQLLVKQFQDQKSLAQRSLASKEEAVMLYRAQGEVKAWTDAVSMLDRMIKQVDNEKESYSLPLTERNP